MPTKQLSSDSLTTRDAGADLTGKEGFLCKLNSSSQAVLAAAGTDVVYGFIDEGAPAGRAVTVQVRGLGNCIAGGNFAVGVSLTSDAAGKAVAATTGQPAIGRARTSGAAGKWVEVDIDRHYAA